MNWIDLTDEAQLIEIAELSAKTAVGIFKHSTRCSISDMAKGRMEREWTFENTPIYHLDLIAYRNISGMVAEKFDIEHQSPQLLIIRNGICVHQSSHNQIRPKNLMGLS